ncbi:hypothetical protein [Rhizobium grahamii]|uniref:PNPLA domain-containing protein n=1 Tax=Rhizobium grahamii TaxID=1120045 RepID=A0A370KHS7_9HYPH|nr:hypothetical protein [Rhizobium grahamii]RDJ05064.1 hypothetical protein B5K06_26190 [Rhizobium grahamii]
MNTYYTLQRFFQRIVIATALALPAAVFLVLTLADPRQYHVVLTTSVEAGWPMAIAIAAAVFSALISFSILAADGELAVWQIPLLTMLPGVLAFAVWHLVGNETATITIVVAGVIAPLLPMSAYWWFRGRRSSVHHQGRFSWVYYAFACICFFGIGLATIRAPIWLPRAIGSVAILVFFLSFVSISVLMGGLRPKFGMSFIFYLLVGALFFPANNHRIPPKTSQQKPVDEVRALLDWLENRKDIDTYRNADLPYPVVFVSSEGGGIYAAAHAYSTLSVLSAKCPTFAQHVFSLVGVSGGALGNALFANHAGKPQSAGEPCGPRDTEVNFDAISADHLSPVLARLLLVESVDRFFPGQWPASDRAQVLSESFLDAAGDSDFLKKPVRESFDPTSSRPAVVSVTVNVEDGRRFVISPFAPDEFSSTAEWWPRENIYGPAMPIATEDTTVMDGAAASARFPWLTPTGRLTISPNKETILADGGYFENSGADTVLDLINEVRFSSGRQYFVEKPVSDGATPCSERTFVVVPNYGDKQVWAKCETRIFLIHFAIASAEPYVDPQGKEPIDPSEDQSALSLEDQSAKPSQNQSVELPEDKHLAPPVQVSQSFVLDPIRALLATRTSRAEIALNRADLEQCGSRISGAECLGNPDRSMGFYRNDIAPIDWNLPLGWYVQEDTIKQVSEKSIDKRTFDYHALKQTLDSDMGMFILHLDPGLFKPGADPSFQQVDPAP